MVFEQRQKASSVLVKKEVFGLPWVSEWREKGTLMVGRCWAAENVRTDYSCSCPRPSE